MCENISVSLRRSFVVKVVNCRSSRYGESQSAAQRRVFVVSNSMIKDLP
jgi:hypothetical protein